MKIYFGWPFREPISASAAESYEFYSNLKERPDVDLVDNFEEADFIFYMMDIRNCHNMPNYMIRDIDPHMLVRIIGHKDSSKEVIIDYNDWTDTRNVPDGMLSKVGHYFKRSMVDKKSMTLVKYDRAIVPISYGIRSDFIKHDFTYRFTGYKYDICCCFSGPHLQGARNIIPKVVNDYRGTKFTGRIDCDDNYGSVSTGYYDVIKSSKIIVTANPPNQEGDFRLWEALLTGNLVLCDEMVMPHLMKFPLVHRKHLVFYKNPQELWGLMHYYINNENEREGIGKAGREYCLKYHKFSDRVEEVINVLKE